MTDQSTLELDDAPAGDGDLLLVAGPGVVLTRRLDRPTLTIGRAPGCDVVIDHRALSRRHAVLHARPLAIQDLGSTNGIRVGDARIDGDAPVPLAAGASFHIGPFAFVVIASGGAGPAAGASALTIDDPTVAGASAMVRTIAASPTSVLILGETGAGKDVLASTIHALSGRSGPLARINCAALAESLLEAELFGHEKGAFTGAVGARAGLLEDAAGGTVFLDELGEMPLSVQAKLLRAVEAREVVRVGATRPVAIDVRFLAATHRDLPAEVAAGRFRHDLYYRLDGVTLRIPPLRARPGAVARLALGFLDSARARATPAFLAALEAHDWPGNVRELRAVIERAVLLAAGGELTPAHLALSPRAEPRADARPAAAPVPTPPAPAPAADAELGFLTDAERADRARVIAALEQCVGNQTRAARQLGISRTTLVNKLALYRIPRPRG